MNNAECGMRNAKWKSRKSGPQSVFLHRALRTSDSKGFTLLEVMIAVAILAMVLVTLLGVKNVSTQNVMLADHITTATLLAKRKMTEMLVTAGTRTVVQQEDEGEFPEEEFKAYAWKTAIAPVPIDVIVKITAVRVAVLWKEGTRQEQVELVSYE